LRVVDLGTAHVNTSLWALLRYLRRQPPRALLADKDRLNRIALCARRLTRAPTRVVVRLGTTVSVNLASRGPLERWLQLTSMRRLYPWADAIVTPSLGAAHDLSQASGIPLSRIHTIASPIVVPEFDTLAESPVEHPWFQAGQPPVVLAAGELSMRKDYATLVRAFATLRRTHPLRLVILGEGRRRAELEQLAAELGVQDELWLPGFVSNPYPYIARAHVFALCSRWEGMPVVLIESLALGTPVVSTDCPSGPRELLQGGRFGRLVPIGDVTGLAKALEETLSYPHDRGFLRSAVRAYTVAESAGAYREVLGLAA
jgi:glycosyltransferase involved in cell wall biosynthesis